MPSEIFLPSAEDTQIVITVGGKSKVTMDIFQLEDVFVDAQRVADDMGTDWKNEFPTLFEEQTKFKITPGQAVLLWNAVQGRLEELKKSLLREYVDSSKQESKSRPRRKKKSG